MQTHPQASYQLLTLFQNPVLTSGKTQESGVPCFLFRSSACQVGWLLGHTCIFSHRSPLYHFAFLRTEPIDHRAEYAN